MGLGENEGDTSNSEPHSMRFVVLFHLMVLVFRAEQLPLVYFNAEHYWPSVIFLTKAH